MTKKSTNKTKAVLVKVSLPVESSFAEVVHLIQQSRQRAFQRVNTELIDLYWRIGEYISGKIQASEWGDGVVAELARTSLGARRESEGSLVRIFLE